MAKNNQEDLLTILQEDSKLNKRRKEKGPKTIQVEDPLRMSGDPLGLIKKENQAKTPPRIKSKDDIVVERYNPDVKVGLTSVDVEQRTLAGMVNTVDKGSTKTIRSIVMNNVFTYFNMLIIGIVILLIWSGASIMQTFALFIATINTIIGIVQEINAKKMIDKLSLLSQPTAIVIRDKFEQEIGISNVVIDDVLYLSSGKQIIVDAVLREGNIEVNESLLTGESDPVIKKAGDTLYSGSFVISGNAYAQATAIGNDIYIEKLTSQARKYKKPKSDIFRSLNIIIRVVGVFIIPFGLALYLLSPGAWDDPLFIGTNIVTTAGAMLGMIPSGLFLLTSVALAVGVVRLGQNNTLVQELHCIEMLARTDTLCLDKTGTITDGSMTVKSIVELDTIPGLPLKSLMAAILNAQNDQNLTSQALFERFGDQKRIRHKNLIAFSSSRKYSAVEFERYGTFALGAPEMVVKNHYNNIAKEVNKQVQKGYRVIVLAHTKKALKDKIDDDLIPLALIMIEDTIREDAFDTIKYFKDNGVNVVVISGDNPITVSRISERVGIENAENYISLENLSDKEVVRVANRYTVFGRVSPHQKKLLVESMQQSGKIVAMTGDGVNDILALREADTSIAMASGSEAARNVSHLVLMDSNFASMPKVVSEGRRVINNIQKVSKLYLTKTLFTVLLSITIIIRALIGHEVIYPLKPSHLTIMEFLVIAVPSFVLALEYNNEQIKGTFLKSILRDAVPGALVVLINALIVYALAPQLNITDESVISTLIGLSATATSFMVLYSVTTPFNTKRRIMFFATLSIAILAILLLPDLLEYNPIFNIPNVTKSTPFTLPQILLLIVLIYTSYPLMYTFTNIGKWVKTIIHKTISVISDMK